MSIFSFFRPAQKTPAAQAKERLQIVMAHERSGRSGPDFLPMLQQELLAVIAKYVDLDQNKVEVKLDRAGDYSTLEVNIELPGQDSAEADAPASPGTAVKKDTRKVSPKSPSAPGKSAASILTDRGIRERR